MEKILEFLVPIIGIYLVYKIGNFVMKIVFGMLTIAAIIYLVMTYL